MLHLSIGVCRVHPVTRNSYWGMTPAQENDNQRLVHALFRNGFACLGHSDLEASLAGRAYKAIEVHCQLDAAAKAVLDSADRAPYDTSSMVSRYAHMSRKCIRVIFRPSRSSLIASVTAVMSLL